MKRFLCALLLAFGTMSAASSVQAGWRLNGDGYLLFEISSSTEEIETTVPIWELVSFANHAIRNCIAVQQNLGSRELNICFTITREPVGNLEKESVVAHDEIVKIQEAAKVILEMAKQVKLIPNIDFEHKPDLGKVVTSHGSGTNIYVAADFTRHREQLARYFK